MFIIGGLLLAYGIVSICKHIEKKNKYLDVVGTVIYLKTNNDLLIDYYYEGDYDDSYTFHAVVEYVVDGTTYSITQENGSNPPQYRIGQKVNLKYNPDNPKEAIFKFGNNFWVLILVGGIFTICGGALTIKGITIKNKI